MPRRILQFALHVAFLFVVVALLAACGGASSTPAPAATAEALGDALTAAELVGTNWQAVAFGSPGNSIPVDPDTTLTLSIGVERYAGSGGCNWFLGVYVAEGDQIAFRSPAETAVVCAEPADVMGQEATYLSALQNVIAYRQQDDLLLGYTSDDQLLLTFKPAEPVDFEGTEWALKFQNMDDQAAPLIIGTTVNATFADGTISGTAGCNTYQASYTLDGEALTISDLTKSDNTCDSPDGIMNQEALYFTNLAAATRLVQIGGMLQLLDADDVTVLAFGAP
jgi:heat shock protein HslJ